MVDFEGNSRSIEEIDVGDYVLARSEFDAAGPLELKRVEEKFVRVAPVMELVVRGQVITTTAEHPFYVAGEERFVPAGELTMEDRLVDSHGRPIAIDAIRVTDRLITVYNLRVADFHTYFVGGKLWQFDAWVHNAYRVPRNASKNIDGYRVGSFSEVGSHHVIQGAAVRDLPGYNHGIATAVDLGSIFDPSSAHRLTRPAQRMPGGGTYASERRIAYRALRDAGVPKDTAKKIVREADAYFASIGVTMTTRTRIPGDR